MSPKARGKIQILLESLSGKHPLRIYLFGSWARNEEDDLSDIDIVVIMDTQIPFLERALFIYKDLPLELGAVDILVYTPEEWEKMQQDGNVLAETVLEEGRIIYGQA
jgi:predicted nucleotidyltransferase